MFPLSSESRDHWMFIEKNESPGDALLEMCSGDERGRPFSLANPVSYEGAPIPPHTCGCWTCPSRFAFLSKNKTTKTKRKVHEIAF